MGKWDKSLYSDDAVTRALDSAPRAARAKYRSDFRRDYARLIHSPAFRRLQGKTQLFPSVDSDFFRNRLTHSIEVAQIAKSIALKLNTDHRDGFLKDRPINTDLIEFAGLAHDLGHPPFGHNGEEALNHRMARYGGFEGNAQTLRILARLEKKTKEASGTGDLRRGLALTMRTYAAVLKYDRPIPPQQEIGGKIKKGYYGSEADLVKKIKQAVCGAYEMVPGQKFRTIECDIMDIADDIAYSTYDLEDSLKAQFVSPFDLIAPPLPVLDHCATAASEAIGTTMSATDVHRVLLDLIEPWLLNADVTNGDDLIGSIGAAVYLSQALQRDGYVRTQLTSKLVDGFIAGITLIPCEACPPLSSLDVTADVRRQIEVLKHFNYAFTIMSPRVRLTAYRG
ncbi:MAG: dGTP triphosphohydrolase, partial [Gammaproteobacteria bacterium]